MTGCYFRKKSGSFQIRKVKVGRLHMKDLKQRNAIVTGCSSGIGPYIARELAKNGVNIVVVARSRDKIEAVAKGIRKLGVKAFPLLADVTDPIGRQAIITQAEAEFGPIDILVNNASQHYCGRLITRSPEMVRAVIETNLLAPMLLTRAVLPGMLERGRGHLVQISSLAGKAGLPFLSLYGASKYGLVGFNHSLQGELKGTGVQSTVVCPGFVSLEGMWARFHRRVHPGFGLNSLDAVARKVVSAIKQDKVEVLINRLPVRPVILLWALMPGLASQIFGLIRVDDFMAGVGQQAEAETLTGQLKEAGTY
jgi:short-subunit dehydrogenase